MNELIDWLIDWLVGWLVGWLLLKEETGDVEAVDDETETTGTDVDILNALTGIPLTEDELLYVVPVVAPYSTLMPYK